jgi:superfamily II DNA or RNA helicase/HKD family nuclease
VSKPLRPGLYEALVDDALTEAVATAEHEGFKCIEETLDPGDSHESLARYVFEAVLRKLRELPNEKKIGEQVALSNHLLSVLASGGDEFEQGSTISQPARVLRSVTTALHGLGEIEVVARPDIPLSQSDLLVNARDEPRIGHVLAKEIASADHIDLLCAFLKWNGLRILLEPLKSHMSQGRRLRVITTTYIGATERRALDKLVEIGADVRVTYETQSTRLHAKAWLFHRQTGFSTAYVGSSNLSYSALLDGLEWNVRLSQVINGPLIDKFAATFESYWENPLFEAYDPQRDSGRFDQAVRLTQTADPLDLAPLDVRPYPHQTEILEQLETQRERHHHHRNLIVAATGTGKTVVAALDYKRLAARSLGPYPKLLFIAHRKEILQQTRSTFRTVLRDGSFGQLYVDGHRPDEWQHVFASIQSLSTRELDEIPSNSFDVVIIDEFHHAAAPTYRRILTHLVPQELVGLTGTPERADGENVLEYFDGRIAAELRLWEALEREILCPFQYFGVHDDVNLSRVHWKRGGYDPAELDNLYTGNDGRVRLILGAIERMVNNPHRMRALGFCVSVAHARFMAAKFQQAGLSAVAVSADTSREDREDALRNLKNGKINVLFAVDIFNEGVDVPEIDTVLFLRPTESATVFLQQLGRGLRRADGKSCLTVLDFIGQAHQRFRFDIRFRALTGATRAEIRPVIEAGFPYLPSGCSILLDRVTSEIVLGNIRHAIGRTFRSLENELRAIGRDLSLAEFLQESAIEAEDLYRVRGSTWTRLRRQVGLPTDAAGPDETELARGIRRTLHMDDPERLAFYRQFIEEMGPDSVQAIPARERRMLMGLHFCLWGTDRKWPSLTVAMQQLWQNPAYVKELLELLGVLEDRATNLAVSLEQVLGWPHAVPLSIHSQYQLDEVLSAFDLMDMERPFRIREGVKYDPQTKSDLLFVTLEKAESHYSPTTLYRDYAISPKLFHWESQSTTSERSETGQRYIHHQQMGSHVLLFVRERIRQGDRTHPYTFLGPVQYVRHSGERPMAIVWELERHMPARFFSESKLAAA